MHALVVVVLAACLAGAAARGPSSSDNVLPSLARGGKHGTGGLKYVVEVRGEILWKDYHMGTGALLSPEWVLTTKVALKVPPVASSSYVRVGQCNGGGGTKVAIAMRVNEPEKKTLVLLKLKNAVTLDGNVRPVTLPYQDARVESGALSAVFAGWGGEGGEGLRDGVVTVLAGARCEELVGEGDVLCSSAESGVGACDGDDGSPLVQDLGNGVSKLLGVTTGTHRVPCRATPMHTTYVDVARHSEWLHKTIHGLP